ncbi:sulfotransferase domain-containing protein [Owenweeksia hongkongensis]|uniref:sulfotransferase domain-containing protein n=1 Tax=Owenweeksia hongkongensis TaxID=253245 RepID=UPI003A90D1BC
MKQTQTSLYPNVIIGGAPKSGTSSLFFWLGAHPEVCASKVKETYFLGDTENKHNVSANIHKDGLEAYQKFFSHSKGEKIRLEATPVYIYHKLPLKVLPTLEKVPKMIFILREPSDRLYSHWRFNRYRMKNTKMTFEDYLAFKNVPSGWADYLDHTHYIRHIQPYIDTLGKENILVYQFEQIKEDKVAFMKQVATDLGISPEFYNSFDFFHRNQTVAVKNGKLHRIGLKLEPLVPQWLQEKIIPLYLKMNSSKLPKPSDEELELKEKSKSQFAESNQELAEKFDNVDLALWK